MSAELFARSCVLAVVWAVGTALPVSGSASPSAASSQGVGGIGGTISDSSGAVLPGATVTLSTSIEPRIDFYNLTNAATILGRITQLGPTYGRVNSIQRGRLIKVGFSLQF